MDKEISPALILTGALLLILSLGIMAVKVNPEYWIPIAMVDAAFLLFLIGAVISK